MDIKSIALRNIKLQQYLNMIAGIGFLAPIITLMYQYYNLDVSQIIIISNIATITMFACELPTSILADIIGRKKSFVYGGICRIGSALILLCVPGRYGFIIASILGSLYFCFFSGTIQAFLQDNLQHIGNQNLFTQYIGHNMFVEKMGSLIIPSIASVVLLYTGDDGYRILAGLDVLTALGGGWIIYQLNDLKSDIHIPFGDIYRKSIDTIKSVFLQFRSNHILQKLLLFRIFGNHVAFFDIMILIILTQGGMDPHYGGFVMTGATISGMIANKFVHRLTKDYGNQKIWYRSIFVQALLCIGASLFISHRYGVIAIYIFYTAMDGLWQPARNGALVEHIDHRWIATGRSIIFGLFALWTTFGKYILSLFQIDYSLLILGIFLIGITIIFYHTMNHIKS